jgi:asparagine synthase (glutamine-hydrolysing)
MCGFAAIAGPHDRALLEELGAALHHRGPDEGGILHDPELQVGISCRRLSILDLAGGHQPMTTPDGALSIAFNGEIFNTPELRARLQREGVTFATDHSDTELVLRLYELRGAAALDELNGMFAFVVLDRRRGVLFGARDRFGIKPLYVARPGGGLAVASELRTLLHVPGVGRTVDRQSLFHFLSLRFVPGERSILEGVERLPPGHFFTYDLGRRELAIERWYRLPFRPEHGVSREEWTRRIREELRASVDRWSLSDVPVACSLSGGLDSSAVVGLLAETGRSDLRTYSLGFSSPEDTGLDELPLARALAARYGATHHEHIADPRELLDDLLQMVWALDEPYGGGLPSWYVFRAMSADVKVGLTGTGGDELFGNYRRFVPFETGRLARLRGGDVRRYHFEPAYYFRDADKRQALVSDGGAPDTAALLQRHYDDSGSRSARDSVLALDLATQLPDEFLHMTDRFSMAFSLEARTPFLDHRFVELVCSVPPALRTSAADPKGLLRDSVADLLTPGHLQAPKRGFVLPLGRWLRGELRPLAEHLLSDERLRAQGLFRPGLAARYLQPHLDGRVDDGERLWPLVTFQLWHLLYVEQGLREAPTGTIADLLA